MAMAMAMAMAIELSQTEMPRPVPLPTFSAPFACPSLRWACKKRLRCFHPDAAAAALRHSLSPDHRTSPSRGCDDGEPRECAAAFACVPGTRPAARRASSRSPPHPPRSPAHFEGRRDLICIPVSSGDDGAGDVREEEPPDLLSPRAPAAAVGAAGEGELRLGGEAAGWSLRSRARAGSHEEETGKKNNKKRKVELWVSLSRDEIERDFLLMTGSKPPRRPRRRGKAGSHHTLEEIFPGSCLPNIVTADQYRVSDPSDSRRR